MATTDTAAAKAKGLDPDFLRDFSHRWMNAWNSYDAEGVAALCTEDIVYDDPALAQTARSRADVAAFVRTAIVAFPGYEFSEPDPALPSPTEQKAIAPWRFSGIMTGKLDPPGFAPTGGRVEFDGVDHWWFRDGLVCRYRADYDLNGVARQIGAAPESGTGAEKIAVILQRLKARRLRKRRL